MQAGPDAKRLTELGMDPTRVEVTSNLKFEQTQNESEAALTSELRDRFEIADEKPLIVAASTHEPEERYLIESLDGVLGYSCRLLIAPRHPERFDAVARSLEKFSYSFVRRTSPVSDKDKQADIILLDTIGELRAAYPLAEIVFVGGSLVPHGGQSILEPAAAGKAIMTGPYTANFDAVVNEFRDNGALRQTSVAPDEDIARLLHEQFTDLFDNKEKSEELGRNALNLMNGVNRYATKTTIELIRNRLSFPEN
jgi:3-deoxy-D-manno-octulosonic-acid transferase